MLELPSLKTTHLIILIVDLLVYNTNWCVVLCSMYLGKNGDSKEYVVKNLHQELTSQVKIDDGYST